MDKKLKRNLSYQTVYQILQVMTPLLVTPYISRILGSENIGIYSYTYSIAYYFVMFAMLGLSNYGSRSIAAVNQSLEKRSKLFWEIYTLQIITSSIMLILYIGYSILLCKNEVFISRLQLLYVLTSIFDISWLFFGLEDVRPVVLKNTIIKLISLVGIFLLVRTTKDLWIYTILMTGGQLLGCISMWFSIKKRIIYVKPSIKGVISHFIPNLTLFIPVIAISIYKTMDKIMLGAFTTGSQVGFYTNAESLINAPMGFIIAVGNVMLPRVTNLIENNESEKSITYFKKSLQMIMCFACAASFGIAAVSPVFVPLYYGDGYLECILLLEGQALVMLFLAWANVVRMQFLLPNKHDKQYISSIISGAIINIILNLILIPRFQANGALIATIFAEGIVCIVQSYGANKYTSMLRCLKENVPYIFAGIVMFLCVRWTAGFMDNTLISLLKQIIIGGCVYLGMIGIMYLLLNKILKRNYINFLGGR